MYSFVLYIYIYIYISLPANPSIAHYNRIGLLSFSDMSFYFILLSLSPTI